MVCYNIFIIKPQPINHALIITNRQASKLKRIDEGQFDSAVFEPLEKFGVKNYDVINRPSESNLDSIVEEDSLLIICGGDGTVTRIVDYVLRKELQNTILPLPFGGANDMSTGLYNGKHLSEILKFGTPEKAYSLEAIIQENNREQKIIRALGYIGIGVSGHAANAINNYQGPDTTELGAMARAANAAVNYQPFKYTDSSGIEKEAFELLSINNRMARFIKSENNTFSHEFTSIEIANRLQLIGKVCLGLFSKIDGFKISPDQNKYIKTLTPTILQYDGEPINIKPGADITIQNGRPINTMRINI